MYRLLVVATTLVLLHSCKAVSPPSANTRPRLVILLVIDQMRGDYLTAYQHLWWEKGAWRLLTTEGAVFRNAHADWYPTHTATGHASIATGRWPAAHGIVGNRWWDRISKKEVYCVEDTTVEPVGGSEEAGRRSAVNLLVPTIGDIVKFYYDEARVFSLSFKDRSAILMGGWSADGVWWFDWVAGRWVTSSWYGKELPAFVDSFSVLRHPVRIAPQKWTLSPVVRVLSRQWWYHCPHYKSPFAITEDSSYLLGEALSSNPYSIAYTPWGNDLLLELARNLIDHYRLGTDSEPDLLAISISSLDYTGHYFGAPSPPLIDILLRLDTQLAQFIRWLDTKVGRNNYILVLTADHGATPTPMCLSERLHWQCGVVNDSLLALWQKKLEQAFNQYFCPGKWIEHISETGIYLNRDLLLHCKLTPAEVEQVAQFALSAERSLSGVIAPILYEEFARSWQPQRSPDLFLMFSDCWQAYSTAGTTHGQARSSDSHVPLVFFGGGIAASVHHEQVSLTQIAHTLTKLLGIAGGSWFGSAPLPIAPHDR